ncbi:hypothetical protein GCM10010300_77400 [Streptomyces olivaceoviridis]|nr:hypothetical protein GCM10010300_77400 [Streptomyces olivaceoviridis]
MFDAHGRQIDYTTHATHTHACPCGTSSAGPRPRGRPSGAVAIRIAVILTAGLVVSVLLVVIRDIVTTVAGTSATGLILKALLTTSSRRDR